MTARKPLSNAERQRRYKERHGMVNVYISPALKQRLDDYRGTRTIEQGLSDLLDQVDIPSPSATTSST